MESKMKTFSKYDPEQGRTYPITVDGETRWAKADDAIDLAYRVKPVNVAMYADSGHNFRGFALHLFHGEFWTVSNDGTYEQQHITHGWARYDKMVRQYDADPRWTRMASEVAV